MHRSTAAHRRARSRWLAAGVLLLGLLCCVPARAQGASPEALKAEVLYRVLMFVTWPAEREAPGKALQLCTVAEGRMEKALQALNGREMRQLVIDVRRLPRTELAGCHLVYLPSPQPTLKPAPGETPVLVVSDAAAMLDYGAMLNLQVEDGRIVFDVDLDLARRAGLTVSTKLLRLARYVRFQTAPP